MRTLSRPMFNMGGPIKQGVMNGIREPHKHGGPIGESQGKNLVGDSVYPKDKTGRAHHFAFGGLGVGALAAISRFGPAAYRGLRASKMFTPWKQNLGKWGRAKDIFWPKKGVTGPRLKGELYKTPFKPVPGSEKAGFGVGSYIGTNPGTSFLLASSVPQAGYAGAKIAGAAPGALWKGTKRYADMVIPGDQSSWWKDKEPPTGVPLNPNLQKAQKELSNKKTKEFSLAQRENRVKKYLEMMGYDQAKKTAIADALIDASKIVSERGTLDPKNIAQELINPIIQATSKRLDKPEQIREAVGLMMTKAGLEKEMYEAKPGTVLKNVQDMVKSGQYTEEEAWAIATKGSQGAVADLQSAISTGKVDAANWPSFVMSTGALHGEEVTHVTDAQLKELYKDLDNIPSAMEIITEREKTEIVPDGIYVIGQETIRINGGKKTQIK